MMKRNKSRDDGDSDRGSEPSVSEPGSEPLSDSDADDEDSDEDVLNDDFYINKYSEYRRRRYAEFDVNEAMEAATGRTRYSHGFGYESSTDFSDEDIRQTSFLANEEMDKILIDKQNRMGRIRSSLKFSNIWNRIHKAWIEAEDVSSSDSEHVQSGHWDHWKAYYCTSNYARYKKFSRSYFSWALIFTIGQCTGVDLIEYMLNNGKGVFLIVLFITYIGIGFPLLLLETMLGQYSGKKPLQLFKYLCPALSGIGPAMYFRTLIVAINSLGFALYSLYYCTDLFFCRVNVNKLLCGFFNIEKKYPKFEFTIFSRNCQFKPTYIIMLFIFAIFLIGLTSLRAKLIGRGYRLGIIILFACQIFYVSDGYSRVFKYNTTSIASVPFHTVVTHLDWTKFYVGKTWMDALIFVIKSTSCGTLVHPYLGSQLFFHYRTARDSALIIALTFIWNILVAFGVLISLGYVCVNKKQMLLALKQLGGPYGVFLTFVMKHNQGNLTNNLEGDILLFNGIFYIIFGLSALMSLICYIQILTDSSYPEKVTSRIKIFVLISYCILFGVIISSVILCDEGLRHIIFLDYYYLRNWSVFFILGCFYWSAAYGHNFSKLAYDFSNIHHFKILPPADTNARIPKLMRLPGLVCICLSMIYFIVSEKNPIGGITEWGSQSTVIVLSFIPVCFVISIGAYVLISFHGAKRTKAFRPHRDWYKNHFHNLRCFNEIPYNVKRKKNKGRELELSDVRKVQGSTPAELLAKDLLSQRR